MPRYTNEAGVVVETSEEIASRIRGLTPADGASPRKSTAKKAAPKKQTPPAK